MAISAQEEANASFDNIRDILREYTTYSNNLLRKETAEGRFSVPNNSCTYPNASTRIMQPQYDSALSHGSLIGPRIYSLCCSLPVKHSFPLWVPTKPNIWSNMVLRSGYVSSLPPPIGNTSLLEQSFSPNYRGNPMSPRNRSADIPIELNTSVWITNLPPHCTYSDLLSTIRDTGKIVSNSHNDHLQMPFPQRPNPTTTIN